MQRARFVLAARNPLQRSRVSSARNAGESSCDLSHARATLCGDRACRARETQARLRFVRRPRNPLRRSCVSSARNASESAICPVPAQPSAEIARVERAKCRRECDLSGSGATLCGDRACRAREMQARVRFVRFRRNPLQRSCVSSGRKAGESAICPVPAQPSAEIARVECAKRRRECDLSGTCRATLCGDRVRQGRERQARVRFVRYACDPHAEIVQARVRFVRCARDPLRRSRLSSVRNAGCPMRAQPSAEIARVECAERRRECVSETCRVTFGGSLVRNACFGDLTLHFWWKSRAKRSFWRLSASLLEEVSYETLVLKTLDSDLASS